MEGVGVGRLGRTSARYGQTTVVFTGPVRKWKKRWIPVSPSNNNNNNNTTNNNNTNNNNNGSHLVLYKWTPLSQTNNNNTNGADADAAAADDDKENEEVPPKRKFKYIPIAVTEEQEIEEVEEVEKVDEETKPTDSDLNADPALKIDGGLDEKPDINDVPMEENEEDNLRQDLNESIDLSLGLTAHEGDSDS
ncbi:hypothetical protein ACFE04_003744 [Oxalis oulophora]